MDSNNMKLRLVFLTSGRFHVFDQVRELIRLGHDVTVYTLALAGSGKKFGIPSENFVWMAPRVPLRMALFMLLRKSRWSRLSYRMINNALDKKMAQLLPDCDAFVSMSGMCIHSLQAAKDKNILTVLQRSSRHIESQAEILRAVSGGEQVADWEISRELREYETADFIMVLSQHCVESFVERGVPREKLFRLMPGVDLSCFEVREKEAGHPRTIIFTGTWSMRKGCDLLVEAWQELKGKGAQWNSLRLMHVGNQGDLDYPEDDGFVHVERVEQSELPGYYSQADVFCMPSREDGFGVVLLQALACGLPLVCSDRTGGWDIMDQLDAHNAVHLVRSDDVSELVEKLGKALDVARKTGRVDYIGSDRERFSWKSHARSLANFVSAHI